MQRNQLEEDSRLRKEAAEEEAAEQEAMENVAIPEGISAEGEPEGARQSSPARTKGHTRTSSHPLAHPLSLSHTQPQEDDEEEELMDDDMDDLFGTDAPALPETVPPESQSIEMDSQGMDVNMDIG